MIGTRYDEIAIFQARGDGKFLAPRRPGIKIWSSAEIDRMACELRGYVKVKIDVNSALALAEATPRPDGVCLAVMKTVASGGYVTLSQLQLLFGWAAQRVDRES